jgi:hypothetical protein
VIDLVALLCLAHLVDSLLRRPRLSSQRPAHASYWTRKDDAGESMVVFESEEGAKAWAERLPSVVPDVVTIKNVDVREVVAHA